MILPASRDWSIVIRGIGYPFVIMDVLENYLSEVPNMQDYIRDHRQSTGYQAPEHNQYASH